MWTRLPDASAGEVEMSIDGERYVAREGDSVAAALLASGVTTFRTTFSGAPRAPLCMMGACFECVVTIDGNRNRQACMVQVAPGMVVETTTPTLAKSPRALPPEGVQSVPRGGPSEPTQ